MKQCEKVGDLFGDLHDRLLDGTLENRVRQHIHECSWCHEEFKWYGVTVQTLGNLERMSPPDDFLVQLNARLSAQPPSWSSSFFDFFRNFFTTAPYMPLPAGVGALALIVAVGFLVYNQAPTDIAPYGVADMVIPNGGARTTTPASMAASGTTGQVHAEEMHVGGMVARATQPDPLNPTLIPSRLSSTPKSLESDSRSLPRTVPTGPIGIGANNLIVESPRIDQALASLKLMLPRIEGRLVDERNGGGKVVVGVMIPPNAYGRLTTELINYGAVAVGTGVEGAPPASVPVPAPAPAKTDGKNVLLYIRFMNSR